ncbi:pyruvate kinase [Priestia endophytica]|jgi:pyruvate kinase|uniref:Pyruvate kinase n=2 Tax=Priestia endophytica TaxID=135735 RepID=A0AAX1Q1I5_9BACI|nr:pyruvate kinase [Priestia endophytica]SFQ88303.1 pyruvate kinase [Priestia endophytica DSM 13796]KYG30859.1 pyruvate kinase [Priestia endophytica]MBG9811403.1 pyruvate kinase [Priestia endophytica]RAS71787.1 pyruvate kinase [Priestia endophytica]
MRKTKIVCTIGPASENRETFTKLVEEGLNVARLNFSHGDFEEHGGRIKTIREVSKETGKTVAILLDTKGPEIRTNEMEGGALELVAGEKIIVSMKEVKGTKEKFSITYSNLVNDVKQGDTILLDDGLIGLTVETVDAANGEIHTTIQNTGVLKNKKGVNVPGVSVSLPGITEKDRADILFGVEQGVDFIAASFVRKAADVLEIRKLLEDNNATDIKIISKIENQEGINNIDEILEVSDGLMVARGDMGVEIPVEEVPLVQKELIEKCNHLGMPVITATQMLDSMQRNPRPTRAEASDVANAIFDGTDAIMLSGETAAGDYPVEAVRTMNSIALRAESALDYSKEKLFADSVGVSSVTDAIGQAVADTAMTLDVKAILAPTESGYTARMISRFRPKATVVAITKNQSTSRKLMLMSGVVPIEGNTFETIDDITSDATNLAVDKGIIEHGDLVILAAGMPFGKSGSTNLLKVHVAN